MLQKVSSGQMCAESINSHDVPNLPFRKPTINLDGDAAVRACSEKAEKHWWQASCCLSTCLIQCEVRGFSFFFFFFQDSARCQYRCVKCHRTWLRLLQGTDSLPAYCTLCISFHRRENLGCVSGSSAHLEHLIFCPGKLEAGCLRQKVWVPDWVANDP